MRLANSSVESCGPPSSFSPRKSMICWVFWPSTYLSPRDSTGTVRSPSFCSWARPVGSSRTFTETKSIPRTDRNSLSLRQLVQPGCQNTLNGSLIRSSAGSRRLVADDTDLVAVEIAHISAIVVRMIVLSDAGRTLVLAAGLQCRRVGGTDRRAVVGAHPDRNAVPDACRLLVERPHDPQLRPPARSAIAHRLGILRMAD